MTDVVRRYLDAIADGNYSRALGCAKDFTAVDVESFARAAAAGLATEMMHPGFARLSPSKIARAIGFMRSVNPVAGASMLAGSCAGE